MKTPASLVLFLLLLTDSVVRAAPPRLTVAVYDFTGDSEATHFDNKTTTLVTADLTTETNLVMLERADLDKALSEQAFGVSGIVSSDAAAKIGQITGAKVLVAGQIIKTDDNHLVIIADIIGTETGRLFADQVTGASDKLLQLTSDLSRKIAQTITTQATNLVTPPAESHAERVARIVKSIKGKNRPSVSISIAGYNFRRQGWPDGIIANEIGAILLKAGFTVVDDNSDTKPELQITGAVGTDTGLPRGELLTGRASVDLKIQERRTGDIIDLDHAEATATDVGVAVVSSAAEIKAADDLAERILPLLAK